VHERDIFLNDWKDGGLDALKEAFGITDRHLQDFEVLLASYCRDSFGGEAFVLLCREGRLFEVNASHDTGAGMAGQWEPEATIIEALRHRLDKGRLGCDEIGESWFADELRFLLAELEVEARERDL
jgi:hypothetical protein